MLDLMAITVFVWFPKSRLVGHASMAIDTTYISWWPTSGDNLALGSLGKKQSIKRDIDPNGDGEGRIPDYASPPILGLDEDEIRQWWSQYNSTSKEIWDLYGNNCSALVLRALEEGGAAKDLRYSSFRKNVGIITPLIVRDAAEVLVGNYRVFSEYGGGTNITDLNSFLKYGFGLVSGKSVYDTRLDK